MLLTVIGPKLSLFSDHFTTFAETLKLLRVTPVQISCVAVGIGVEVGDAVRVVVRVCSGVRVDVEVALGVEDGVFVSAGDG